ncbi:MAG: L-arabinose isomerase [Acidobacteriota bacterium]|jgi:L-arabinose isomerase
MIDLVPYELWFVTGSQHLYGEEALREVAAHAEEVAAGLDASEDIPVRVVYKPVLTTPEEITALCREASAAPQCIGLIAWMHTFSPAKMWIGGLSALDVPLAHLHTQFGRDIPWASIDMDYMNLHQSAHGGREFGHICARMGVRRKVVVGHWKNPQVLARLGAWSRAACAWADSRRAKVARFGDNMRQVAVTEGDKVAAQMCFGYSVNGYGMGDLAGVIDSIPDGDIDAMCAEYDDTYDMAEELRSGGARRDDLREAARIEIGLREFLWEGGFVAFTDTFEDLHGLRQLPGIGAQRLMADGFGFGAEGDWKTAALVRAMKVMAHGLPGGTSFMEDYTYHFDPASPMVLGAHMLEICPSIAAGTPRCEIHPLSIGGKEDPVRLVFDTPAGAAVNVAIHTLGDRPRMLLNEVEVVEPKEPLPKLPVARALWKPLPDLATAAATWILAGGPHHTGFSPALTVEHLEDFADIAGVELLVIDADTTVSGLKKEMRANDAYYGGRR